MAEFAEIVFACSDPAESRRIRRGLNAGKLRPLLKRVYTSNLKVAPKEIVRENLDYLLWKLFPGGVLSHRTALNPIFSPEFNPEFRKYRAIYVTYPYTQRVEWPGVTIFLLKGPGPLPGDVEIDETLPGLRVSSLARALLENLGPCRPTDKGRKCIGRATILNWMRTEFSRVGPAAIELLRAESGAVAELMGTKVAHQLLEQLIQSALAGKGRITTRRNWRIARVLAAQS